jgi:hypothetical protein
MKLVRLVFLFYLFIPQDFTTTITCLISTGFGFINLFICILYGILLFWWDDRLSGQHEINNNTPLLGDNADGARLT